MWRDLAAALALVLVLEGILPFLNPQRFRESMAAIARFNDRHLRAIGLACMLGGIILLYVVRSR